MTMIFENAKLLHLRDTNWCTFKHYFLALVGCDKNVHEYLNYGSIDSNFQSWQSIRAKLIFLLLGAVDEATQNYLSSQPSSAQWIQDSDLKSYWNSIVDFNEAQVFLSPSQDNNVPSGSNAIDIKTVMPQLNSKIVVNNQDKIDSFCFESPAFNTSSYFSSCFSSQSTGSQFILDTGCQGKNLVNNRALLYDVRSSSEPVRGVGGLQNASGIGKVPYAGDSLLMETLPVNLLNFGNLLKPGFSF